MKKLFVLAMMVAGIATAPAAPAGGDVSTQLPTFAGGSLGDLYNAYRDRVGGQGMVAIYRYVHTHSCATITSDSERPVFKRAEIVATIFMLDRSCLVRLRGRHAVLSQA